ncbi:uncharacterized protein JN550_006975 [Neoarthrinium moseri]|uniref:uncharacterized protein n=1 Tax=Neoarthrinium moseri TaxID=1658444 RepID=UPI001FDD20B6|nr:uncharacterized protein JN550_006975 [Neoarthrinium moseri]KAI1867834.1 hypothetical protein JN550_006975 [Neoarthrinium moseri]
MAKHDPARILFTGRNAKSAAATLQRIKSGAPNAVATFVACDVASLSSVSSGANQILTECDRLDVFLANGGIIAKPAELSTDGYEIHFASNHMGHALLAKKLLPLLEKTADLPNSNVRIIYTTSLGWRNGTLDPWKLKTPMEAAILGRWIRYGNSKLDNMFYAREIARRHPKVLSSSLHPGARSSGQIKTRGFYEPVGVFPPEDDAVAKDDKFAKDLWEYTEKELEKWM